MTELDKAIEQIADIRAQLAHTTRFRGYAPEVIGALGVMSLVVCLLQVLWPDRFAQSDRQLVIAWGILVAGGCGLTAFEAIVRTLRDGNSLAYPLLASAMRIVVPGAVMTASVPFAVLSYAPEAAWVVPGIWQMLTGLITFASYASLPKRILWPGAWFVLSGATGLFLAGANGGLTPLLIGLPYIIGHLGIAWAISDRGPHTDVC